MTQGTVRMKFKATPELPSWLHRKARIETVPYGKATTTRVIAPVTLTDKMIVDMDAFEAEWVVAHYPANFERLEQRAPKKPKDTGDS